MKRCKATDFTRHMNPGDHFIIEETGFKRHDSLPGLEMLTSAPRLKLIESQVATDEVAQTAVSASARDNQAITESKSEITRQASGNRRRKPDEGSVEIYGQMGRGSCRCTYANALGK